MKKNIVITLIAAMTFTGILAGCSGTEEPGEDTSGEISARTEDETTEEILEEEDDLSSETAETEGADSASGSPAVYMTTDINSDGLLAVYEALQASPEGNIAVKLSTGEPGSNYLRTDLIGDLVQSFDDPTIVECNTAYGGSRANTAMHYQVAEDHGYTEIANVDIMDEDGSMTLPVTGGTNLEENYVGSHFENYDYYVVLYTAAPSRIFPSALPPRKGKPIFTAAVPAAVCGAEIRTHFWSLWRRTAPLWWSESSPGTVCTHWNMRRISVLAAEPMN